jgi:integral membrane sensor domain MASE1
LTVRAIALAIVLQAIIAIPRTEWLAASPQAQTAMDVFGMTVLAAFLACLLLGK